jgi:hypothetical protein
VYDVIWLRPLAYPHEDRLMAVSGVKLKNPANTMNVTLNTFFDWKDQFTSFEHMGLQLTLPMTLVGGERPMRIQARGVVDGYFDTLGGKTILGRLFLPKDFEPGSPMTVILSYPLWRDLFGSDPEIVGRKVNLGTNVYIVAGVTSPDYQPLYGGKVDLWAASQLTAETRTGQIFQVYRITQRRSGCSDGTGRNRRCIPPDSRPGSANGGHRRPDSAASGLHVWQLGAQVSGFFRSRRF